MKQLVLLNWRKLSTLLELDTVNAAFWLTSISVSEDSGLVRSKEQEQGGEGIQDILEECALGQPSTYIHFNPEPISTYL